MYDLLFPWMDRMIRCLEAIVHEKTRAENQMYINKSGV